MLTGSLIRVPLGIWTDKYGGRIVFFALMLACVVPIWLMSYATAYWHFLVIGLFVGLAGGSASRWARPTWRAGSRRAARASPWACSAPATRARRSTSSSRPCWWWPSAGPWCRRSMRRCDAGHGHAVLVLQLQRPQAPGGQQCQLHEPAEGAEGPQGAEVLPVLQHRVRRLCGAVAVDGAVLRRRVRPGHPRGRAAGGLLLAARRRAARDRRLDERQVRRPQRHLVGDVGELDLPVPAPTRRPISP